VGNLQPRKNLETLVEAYARVVQSRPDLPERLVLVGKEVYAAGPVYERAATLRQSGRVLFTGYLPHQDLIGLLQGATAFAYPSVYEGFGLPPVEAMVAGVPALVSDIPVMREVAGEAALRLPPLDPAAWADALMKVATDARLRSSLIERGRARAARYTWEACAEVVLAALERAAGLSE
jgi:glycosyltransferase involved in cell wall biosynthesis